MSCHGLSVTYFKTSRILHKHKEKCIWNIIYNIDMREIVSERPALKMFSEILSNKINVCYGACFTQGWKRIESNYLSVRERVLKIKISYFNLFI